MSHFRTIVVASLATLAVSLFAAPSYAKLATNSLTLNGLAANGMGSNGMPCNGLATSGVRAGDAQQSGTAVPAALGQLNGVEVRGATLPANNGE